MDAVLVTGTSGLVGYEAALHLHVAGVDVLGLDLRPPPAGAPFRAEVGDVADLDTVTSALHGRRNIVHAGAISGPMLMLDNPHGIAQANIGGTMAVLQAAHRAGVRRLVFLSSIAVYGDQPTLEPVAETAPPNPQSFYGHTKVAGEVLLNAYRLRYGLNAVALRLSSVFGVRRQTACGLSAVIDAGWQGRTAHVAAPGSSFRQYLHVVDAARSVSLALTTETAPGYVYNITGGTYVTEAEIAGMIREIVPELRIEYGSPAWNEGHLGPLLIDAAARDLGYSPQVTLPAGLIELSAHRAAETAG